MHNLFNPKSRKELDQLIKDRLGQGSLVTEMEADEKKKSNVIEGRLLQWSDEWKKYPYLYVFLVVSALFTLTLGMFMGIAPKINDVDNTVFYHTDLLHLFLAFVYMVAFVSITEGAFAIAKWLFHTRENGNNTQTNTMLAMMGIAGVSIVGTGIAGGMVVASNIAFLSEFIEIPPAAQKWVIVIIPILLAVYAFLLTAYSLSSNASKSERMLHQMNHKSKLDHQTRQRGIMQIAEEELQVTELNLYLQMVAEGKMSSAQATAAIKAGRTLGQEEIRQGRDIDGHGGIGNGVIQSPPPVRSPMPKPAPAPAPLAHVYTFAELLDYAEATVDQVVWVLQSKGITDAAPAYDLMFDNGWLPIDLTRQNFGKLFEDNVRKFLVPVTAGGNGSHPL